MNGLLNSPGFLGTNAPFHADVALILILVSAVMFTTGWRLAVRKRYEAHRWVQTSAVILSTIVILFMMINSFLIHILPGIPGKLNQGDYALTTVHALVGSVAMLLGIFIVLRANKLVPKALRFRNYKRFMRTSYVLYMLATFLGVIVYITVYVFGI
jgi:putative membrane protein